MTQAAVKKEKNRELAAALFNNDPQSCQFAESVLSVAKTKETKRGTKRTLETPEPVRLTTKELRQWMKDNAEKISASTPLPGGAAEQTCGSFLFEQWKERCNKKK